MARFLQGSQTVGVRVVRRLPEKDDHRAMASTPTDIYERPDVYELEYAESDEEDVRFFTRALARLRPARVLELACGAGRITPPLAAALPATEIVGVDSSLDMLERAKEMRGSSGAAAPNRLTFLEGDMRSWAGDGTSFDAVVIPCCSVSHLLTLNDRRQTWATAFRLLRPGGHFIVDVRAPDLATLAESQRVKPRAFVDLDVDATRQSRGEDARLLRCTATTYEPHLQRANVRLVYDKFDARELTERFVTDYHNHIYFPAELELLFIVTGFEIAQQYGDYAFGAFGRTSPFLITVARKPLD